jgi:Flp pilus assembly protein TadG
MTNASAMPPRSRGRERRAARVRAAVDRRGTAAVELAMIAPLFAIALLNTVDIARYFYELMEVQNAAQIGAQAAWTACDVAHLPATTNCPGLNAAVSAAIKATSLGSSVTLVSGSPSEGYYCVNSSGALVYVADMSSKPADCSSVGNAAATPGDYIKVQVSFAYAPIFAGLSVAGAFPSPSTSTSIMRLV